MTTGDDGSIHIYMVWPGADRTLHSPITLQRVVESVPGNPGPDHGQHRQATENGPGNRRNRKWRFPLQSTVGCGLIERWPKKTREQEGAFTGQRGAF